MHAWAGLRDSVRVYEIGTLARIGAELPCELAEKLVRSGHEPQARLLWQQARAGYPDDVRVYVQAGWHRVRRHRRPRRGLEWLTTGPEPALHTGDPESALEHFRPSRASCLSALGRPSGEIQERAAQGEQGKTGEQSEVSAGHPCTASKPVAWLLTCGL